MKKAFLFILFALVGLGLTSCLHDNEEVFDNSAAERINIAVEKARTVLESAPNGWVLHYYRGAGYAFGGLDYTMKFINGKVTVCRESTKDGNKYTAITSTYKVSRDQGPVLALDTYNDLIHIFGDPDYRHSDAPTFVEGWQADYEFLIMNISDDENTITLRGKKYGNRMLLERLNVTSEDYLNQVDSVRKCLADYPILLFNDNGRRAKFYDNGYSYQLKYFDTTGKIQNIEVPYTLTNNGVLFNEPIKLFDNDFTGFNISDTTRVGGKLNIGNIQFIEDPSKKLILSDDAVDQFRLGNWYLAPKSQQTGPVVTGLQSFVDGAMNDSQYEILYVFVGTRSDGYYGLTSDVGTANPATTTFIVTTYDDDPNLISFAFGENIIPGLATYFSRFCNYEDLAGLFYNTFRLSKDNDKDPQVFTLTDVNNPANVIKLVKEVVMYPGKN